MLRVGSLTAGEAFDVVGGDREDADLPVAAQSGNFAAVNTQCQSRGVADRQFQCFTGRVSSRCAGSQNDAFDDRFPVGLHGDPGIVVDVDSAR